MLNIKLEVSERVDGGTAYRARVKGDRDQRDYVLDQLNYLYRKLYLGHDSFGRTPPWAEFRNEVSTTSGEEREVVVGGFVLIVYDRLGEYFDTVDAWEEARRTQENI